MKLCTKCGVEKDSGSFRRDSRNLDGLQYQCRECAAAYQKLYYSEYPEKRREGILKHKYGLSWSTYMNMYEKQDGRCAICKKELDPIQMGKIKSPTVVNVDHDHETGEVRGLLCGTCNSGLGHFKDSEKLMLNAINYLRSFREMKEFRMDEDTFSEEDILQ
jgi:hypothetical protein